MKDVDDDEMELLVAQELSTVLPAVTSVVRTERPIGEIDEAVYDLQSGVRAEFADVIREFKERDVRRAITSGKYEKAFKNTVDDTKSRVINLEHQV